MQIAHKLIKKFLLNTKKNNKNTKDMEDYWIKFEKNWDRPLDDFFMNKKVKEKDYQKTPLVELALFVIKEKNDEIKHRIALRNHADEQYIKLNILFLTIYSYITTMNLVDALVFYIVVLIGSLMICNLWEKKVKTTLELNTADYAVIRKCQDKYLPIRPFGDSTVRLIQSVTGCHHHTGYLSSMALTKIFSVLYIFIFVIYLINKVF